MPHELPFDLEALGQLRIPGYSKQESLYGNGLVPLPNNLAGNPPQEWYNRFLEVVLTAAKRRRWLPVYRLSDGEFTCMVGRRFATGPLLTMLRARARHVYNSTKRLSPFYSSGRPGYCESYYAWELPGVRRTLSSALAEIANDGALCFNFSQSDLATPYMEAVCAWLGGRGVNIPASCYFHFYHVYGLLNGPDAIRLLTGRRVVVMTSDIGNRRDRLLTAVLERGASSAAFYETSRNKPAHDVIRLKELPAKVDVILLGAGVGAAQIIQQLKPLGCLAIDAGFALDCWAEPDLRRRRPYCVHDDVWDEVHGTERPEWC
jgi:hypothetical protein